MRWPVAHLRGDCSLAQVHLRIPKRITEYPPPPPTEKPGQLYVETEVQLNQLQDLVELLPDILKQAKGLDLHLRVGLEVRAAKPDAAKLRALNDAVKDISQDLVFPVPPK